MVRNNNIICIIQARIGSKRLPGKVMKLMLGKPMLENLVNNVIKSKYIQKLIIATSDCEENNIIEELCRKLQISCFRGSEQDVLSRFEEINEKYKPKFIIRLTADNPFVDFNLIDFLVEETLAKYNHYDYINNIENSGFPIGLYVEIFKGKKLKEIRPLKIKEDLEHVTTSFRNNKSLFKIVNIKTNHRFKYDNLTVDTLEEFKKAEKILLTLKRKNTIYNFKSLII
ncbi:MAG: spore coat protein [Rhodospirillaceae bacterium]|nr:spore coat protein [Rhodospirillaceae bacterium]|tara:strand:- start:138 stop:818 length:681 start_codon:yes stop_codon:yes gene_type:complete